LKEASYGAIRVDPAGLLDVDDAHALYQLGNNNALTAESEIGMDLLINQPAIRVQRDQYFWNVIVPRVGDGNSVYGLLANDYYRPLQVLVNAHIQLSEHLYRIHGNAV
jgi:hypothetical protein